MLKFIKHHMSSIAGIEIYPLISFLIFFLFFLVVTILVFSANRDHHRRMARLPLGEMERSEESNPKNA